LDGIFGLQLTEDDANSGHLTAIFQNATWYLLFDFRYNAARIRRYVDVARQFMSASETSLSTNNHNAAAENLFAAVELMAKCYLMMLPDERFLRKTRHGFVATEFNRHGGKYGNVGAPYVELFNDLTAARINARYPDEPLKVTAADLAGYLETARGMLGDLESKRPRLFGDTAGAN